MKQLLVVIVGLSVIIVLFYAFSTSSNRDVNIDLISSDTFYYYDVSLCKNPRLSKVYETVPRDCPEGVVTVRQGGRLCNQIWEYASVWAVAKQSGFKPYVPTCLLNVVKEMFENLSVPPISTISNCPLNTTTFVTASFDRWDGLTNLILPIYSMEPEMVLSYLKDIPKEFVIKQSLVEESQRQLKLVRRNLNTTFVGVHIRRTDYIGFLHRLYGEEPADINFYKSAMKIFEEKYRNVLFVVVSDDPDWCYEHFGGRRNVYVIGRGRRNSAEVDLAILSSCNHTIFDYGTYGAWGAIMAGGDTIYYNITEHYSHRIAMVMENWITL